MEELPRELLVVAAGSILGALILYLAQSGVQLTKGAREHAIEKRQKEVDA